MKMYSFRPFVWYEEEEEEEKKKKGEKTSAAPREERLHWFQNNLDLLIGVARRLRDL